MELSLIARVSCRDQNQRDFLLQMLSEDSSRPAERGDLPEDQRAAFDALEFIDMPEGAWSAGDNALGASWLVVDETPLLDVALALGRAGITGFFALLLSDEGAGELWYLDKGEVQRHMHWDGREIGDLADEADDDLMPLLEDIRNNAGKVSPGVSAAPASKPRAESIPAPSASAWKGETKPEQAERKALWKVVQQNLVLITKVTEISRASIKYHRELFFEGTHQGMKGDVPGGGPRNAFAYMEPLFWIWYHPEIDALDIDELRNQSSSGLDNLRRSVLDNLTAAGAIPPNLLPSDYGLMGGREQLVMQYLCPGVDYQEKITLTGRLSHSTFAPCPWPEKTFWTCLGDTQRELRTDALFYPHSMGQFLWPQLSFNLEHYPDEFLVSDQNGTVDYKRGRLLMIIAEIQNFPDREDASTRRPSTIALVDRINRMREDGEMSPALLELWAEAEHNLEALLQENREEGIVHMSEDQCREWFGEALDPEASAARIAAWPTL